jgi:hypothetical protein
MNKQEVDQVLIIVRSGKQEALHMKIYRDGTLCRKGCGGLPEVGISAMSHTGSPAIFDQLMEIVPQEILDNPLQYKDEQITTPLEYIIGFYGVSKNGETGEQAEWTKSTGIQLLLDSNTSFRNAVLAFADTFSMEAIEKTNSWYFDVVVHAVYKLKSNALPETIIAVPPAEKEVQTHYEHYVHQIRSSPRRWDITSFSNNKVYTDASNNQFAPFAVLNDEVFKLRFIPIGGKTSLPAQDDANNNKWWKVW